jgi:hypothetical protein
VFSILVVTMFVFLVFGLLRLLRVFVSDHIQCICIL